MYQQKGRKPAWAGQGTWIVNRFDFETPTSFLQDRDWTEKGFTTLEMGYNESGR